MRAVEVPRTLTYDGHANVDMPPWTYTVYIHGARQLRDSILTFFTWLPLELLLLLEQFQLAPCGPPPPRFSYRRWATLVVMGQWKYCADCNTTFAYRPIDYTPDYVRWGNHPEEFPQRPLKWHNKRFVCKSTDQCVANVNAVTEAEEKLWPTRKRKWHEVELEANIYNVYT